MKTFILVGETTVTLFQHADWSLLEKAILEQNRGDIVAWDKETDNVSIHPLQDKLYDILFSFS